MSAKDIHDAYSKAILIVLGAGDSTDSDWSKCKRDHIASILNAALSIEMYEQFKDPEFTDDIPF